MDQNEESKRQNAEDVLPDKNVKIFKSKFLKFWPSKSSRDAWRLYVF